MAQSNGDEELREKISNLMADLMVESRMIKLADKPSMIEQGRDYINAHNKRLNVIMQLILADCKQHELEARAAIRTAVERATPKMWPITDQPDEYARQKAIGHNQAITDYKANLERELFG